MADTFHITGFNVYFRGYHVATLETRAPETVMADVVETLHAFDAELTYTQKEHDQAYDDGYDDAEKATTETMQAEIDALQAELTDARAEIESLKSLLRSAAP